MKLIDKKYRLFGVINLLDILIIAVLAAVVVVALRFSAPQTVSAKTGDVKIRYTLELPKKEQGFESQVAVGAEIYDSLRGYDIGKITEVNTQPYMEDVANMAADRVERVPVDGYENVYVTVEANAQVTDYTTAVGAYTVLVGEDVYVRSAGFASSGYVVIIERNPADE